MDSYDEKKPVALWAMIAVAITVGVLYFVAGLLFRAQEYETLVIEHYGKYGDLSYTTTFNLSAFMDTVTISYFVFGALALVIAALLYRQLKAGRTLAIIASVLTVMSSLTFLIIRFFGSSYGIFDSIRIHEICFNLGRLYEIFTVVFFVLAIAGIVCAYNEEVRACFDPDLRGNACQDRVGPMLCDSYDSVRDQSYVVDKTRGPK